ncbi:polyhydroxyalkanoate depolymerase [Cohaesibacter gelatinilyticus]|uniref:Poly(3-hydroxybutyrate) depolymerase n=1 Tax=Cohaesibacter gelatinilyticus TaxID=372072 RepID=A0A285PH20_9HYPH|nr:polyhydroxyalkanoate depolymerase [Cohaesibacter gelatinilyticus]SNZ20547.1 poly(3-hydroxybutyrate) depolymerase [Cohaesibacter gelatinilyticus]
MTMQSNWFEGKMPEFDLSAMPLPFYQLYEWNHAILSPWRAAADATRIYLQNPVNPISQTPWGKSLAAACELFERTTRQYGKPEFDLEDTTVDGEVVSVHEKVVWQRPFCNLLHFERMLPADHKKDPKLLIVAPMSGHYATLLRGTVETMLPNHDVYITDWIDARLVPVTEGEFGLCDYIEYIMDILHHLGPNTHIMAVCQPSVPVMAAAAVMNENNDPMAPASMTLMGGPIDTRISPTAVNDFAKSKGDGWFERNVIMHVPFPHAGFSRKVYPGFLQLGGFMGMNLDRHVSAHQEFYNHLIIGDGDSAEKHRDFYDEYLAVMDLTAEFYLQTVKAVFLDHSLPNGTLEYRGKAVDCSKIIQTALMSVEGEKDDISGVGQTKAAHDLCPNLSDDKRDHYEQAGVGHYGVFNGSRFRSEIAPRISAFIRKQDHELGATEAKTKSAASKPAAKRAPRRKAPAKKQA